jgi:tripartite-type tricarboxylate transporter receptor subunit TctC
VVPDSVRSVAAFAEWARANPQRAQYGTPGIGTMTHVLAELLAREASWPAQHIPYGGGPPAIADAMGGRLAAVFLPEGLLRQLHDAGRLRVLATSGARRSALLPGVPTLQEAGYPRLVVGEWFGFFVRRGTSPELVQELAAEIAAAASVDVGQQLADAGLQVLRGTPTQTQRRLQREKAFWREQIRGIGIRVD